MTPPISGADPPSLESYVAVNPVFATASDFVKTSTGQVAAANREGAGRYTVKVMYPVEFPATRNLCGRIQQGEPVRQYAYQLQVMFSLQMCLRV